MSLKRLTWEELETHLEQAQIQQQEALIEGDGEAYELAEELEQKVIAERHRRQQEREEPDTERVVL